MLYDTNTEQERAVLVAAELPRDAVSAAASLDELKDLAKTAGAMVTGRIIQKRDRHDMAYYIGKGKLEDVAAEAAGTGSNMVIFDDELSPAQLRNISAQLPDVKVIDRTLLILDIFARHAQTAENRAQVELAQLKYRLSRLVGAGAGLSRLAGGIGTRGPGESKLETDRRRVRERIAVLNDEIKRIAAKRDVQRKQRERSGAPVVSLVGYTNAGKSTIMNMLTRAGVPEEDKLFATLDTTTRRCRTRNGTEFLLTDTVGFIRKLPHHLVKAFYATLEELTYSDLLLHVADASDEARDAKIDVVYKTLDMLKCGGKPVIAVYNKIDRNPALPLPTDARATLTRETDAKHGVGKDELMDAIETALQVNRAGR